MLEEIHISNFAIIDTQTVPFAPGFNVLSGETGAGKSILIDALGLQLGDRADSNWIRHGTSRCDIQSRYRFATDSAVQQWLVDNEFNRSQVDNSEDSGSGLCQLRRTLSAGGKSRCYINGIPTTVSNTKALGEMLVDIHGQHAHQSLMHPQRQLDLLDHFAAHADLLQTVRVAFSDWQQLLKAQKALSDSDNSLQDKRDLLHYQLSELQALDLVDNEFEALANEQKRLAAAQDILQQINAIEQALDGDNSLSSALNHIVYTTEQISQADKAAAAIGELFNQALIYVDEGRSALTHFAQSVELNPERLAEVEQRMRQVHDLARKHRIEPEALMALQSELAQQLAALEARLSQLDGMQAALEKAGAKYYQAAEALSASRQAAARRLQQAVMEKLALLNLGNARFSLQFKTAASAKSNGTDQIMFQFAPNPGQGEKPLHKIASGGELSRISLGIQVAGLSAHSDATLIFDEVDSGIGGATAEVVGRLLKTLSQFNQVICVTHLAQVAAFADCHINIHKSVQGEQTFTHFQRLDDAARIEELSRMSGGITPNKKTREHAEKLRENAIQFSRSL